MDVRVGCIAPFSTVVSRRRFSGQLRQESSWSGSRNPESSGRELTKGVTRLSSATLYIFSGLPGSGKTTLSWLLARRVGAAHVRVDTIEQALRELCSVDVQGEGYRVAYRVASDILNTGVSVVADSCKPIALTRHEWHQVALVPLGFVCHQGALYAMTTQGQKTRMATINPRVSFQIDTSVRTGPFSWHSISGEGAFEIVTDSNEIEAVSPLLVSRFPDMPDWMQTEYAEKQEQGSVVFVRIRPSRMIGRKSEPA